MDERFVVVFSEWPTGSRWKLQFPQDILFSEFVSRVSLHLSTKKRKSQEEKGEEKGEEKYLFFYNDAVTGRKCDLSSKVELLSLISKSEKFTFYDEGKIGEEGMEEDIEKDNEKDDEEGVFYRSIRIFGQTEHEFRKRKKQEELSSPNEEWNQLRHNLMRCDERKISLLCQSYSSLILQSGFSPFWYHQSEEKKREERQKREGGKEEIETKPAKQQTPNAQDEHGHTLLHILCSCDLHAAIPHLLPLVSPLITDHNGLSPLHLSLTLGNTDSAFSLLSTLKKESPSLFQFVARQEVGITSTTRLTKISTAGQTPLQLAKENISPFPEEIVQLLSAEI